MSRPSEVYARTLSPQERAWVHRLYQQTTHVGLKSRCHIVLLSAQRYSVPQIAALLFSSEDTVARCIHEFNRSGLEGILPAERVGRPTKITEDFLKKLLELVKSDPRDLQLPFSTWSAELLALALKEQTGLVVSESCVRRTLHRQGYSVQRPVLSVSSPDLDYGQKVARLQDELELVCLPTYSPKLNPVERFWKHLRRQVTHSHFFQTMERLMEAVTSFFREMAAAPELVRSVTGLAAYVSPAYLACPSS